MDLSSYGIVVNLNLRPIICHDVSLQASDTDTKRQLNESQVTFSSHHKSCMMEESFFRYPDERNEKNVKMSRSQCEYSVHQYTALHPFTRCVC